MPGLLSKRLIYIYVVSSLGPTILFILSVLPVSNLVPSSAPPSPANKVSSSIVIFGYDTSPLANRYNFLGYISPVVSPSRLGDLSNARVNP